MEQTELTTMYLKFCKALQDQKETAMAKTTTTKTVHHETDIPSPVSVRDTAKLMELALDPPLSRSSSDSNPRKRKKVQFQSTKPQAYEAAVSSRSATTKAEKAAFWYARSELDEFRHRAKRQCKRAWDERSSDLERIGYPFNFSVSSEAPASASVQDSELYKVSFCLTNLYPPIVLWSVATAASHSNLSFFRDFTPGGSRPRAISSL